MHIVSIYVDFVGRWGYGDVFLIVGGCCNNHSEEGHNNRLEIRTDILLNCNRKAKNWNVWWLTVRILKIWKASVYWRKTKDDLPVCFLFIYDSRTPGLTNDFAKKKTKKRVVTFTSNTLSPSYNSSARYEERKENNCRYYYHTVALLAKKETPRSATGFLLQNDPSHSGSYLTLLLVRSSIAGTIVWGYWNTRKPIPLLVSDGQKFFRLILSRC